MKIDPNNPAMPIKEIGFNATLNKIAISNQHADFKVNFVGLSIRAELAARALQGLLSSWGQHDVTSMEELASDAVKAADVLIAELNKEE